MTKALNRFLACVVFASVVGGLALATQPPLAAEDARLPEPPQEKVEQSLALIRDAYEADYQAAKESGEPEQLIAQLTTLAEQEADPVRKYALFVEAENVAAAHDNYKKAVELLDARAELFRVDGLAFKGELLKRLAGPKVSADLELCDQAMAAARQSLRSERFGLASEAAALAVGVAKAIDREQRLAARKQRKKDGGNIVAPASIGADLVKKAAALQAQVTATAELFEQYGDAVEKAKKSPDSPSANAVIGSYLCFVREDWKAGLPALVKSNLGKFPDLAAEELKLTAAPAPIDAQKGFELAGKWWAAAESKDGLAGHESAIKDHAAGFYADVVDRLTGTLEQRLANSRLRGLTTSDQPVGKGGMILVQGGRLPDQSALAGIEVLPFKIASTETTWREWQDVRDYAVANGFDLETAGHGDGATFPARGISWFAAAKWCNAKSLKEKLRPVYLVNGAAYRAGESVPIVDSAADGYRLPTDAEWEWAARGGVRSKGFGFSGSNEISEVAWFSGNNNPNGPKPVGTKVPNELGLYDMTGNVWEWCWDELPSGDARRFRSASYDDPPGALVVRGQHATWPGNSGEDIGFRYARNAERRPALFVNKSGDTKLTDLQFVMEAGGVVITGYTGSNEVVTIPRLIQGRPVIAIGKEAFKENVTVTRVVLPQGLIRIGHAAFVNCRQLAEVVIPEGVRDIEGAAFIGTALTTLTLPASLEKFEGSSAINSATHLASITAAPGNSFFKSVDGILYDANLRTVIRCPENYQEPVALPKTVRTIGWTAFHGCKHLEKVALPENLEEIGSMAFYGCGNLKSIAIPPKVRKIHAQTFVLCGRLAEVSLSEGLESIGDGVFWGCENLTRVNLPESLTDLNEGAFKNCPAKIERVGDAERKSQ